MQHQSDRGQLEIQEYVLQNYGRLSLIWRDGRTASGLYIDPPVLPKRPGGRKW